MKIGILTQSLSTNYGGMLQAYALQKTLKNLGHTVYYIHRKKKIGLLKMIKQHIKHLISIILKRPSSLATSKRIEILEQNLIPFRELISPKTKAIYTTKELLSITKNLGLNAFVVGSDQVWRPKYSPNIYNYFLDFCQSDKTIKKIAYSASFGVDNWEYNEEEEKKCKVLIKNFDAISVREFSGIDLCKNHFDIDAILTLDPVFLLDSADYINLIFRFNETLSEGNLFCHFFDYDQNKESLIRELSDKGNLTPFSIIPKKSPAHFFSTEDIVPFPSVTKWLRAFYDSKMILTDSFHGCAFSIIFNKPFIVFLNPQRGNSRIISLLKLFGLENKIYDSKLFNNDIPINWGKVNDILFHMKEKSIKFLTNNLQN